MRIAIIGAKGMLGQDLIHAGLDAGLDVKGYDLPEIDITHDSPGLDAVAPCEWVVNCAAYTDVDGAESHSDLAFAVNAAGAGRVARWCAGHGASLLHISTDYVFDGSLAVPYGEKDVPTPLNVYGRSKLDGEKTVQHECPSHIILRTQSLFGVHGKNFVKAILARLDQGQSLRVVCDQTSAPTYTGHLATAILRLLKTDKRGIVHVSAGGFCTWFDFAKAIAARVKPDAVIEPVTASEYGRPACRPPYSVFDMSRYEAWTGEAMPTWQEGLDAYLREPGQTCREWQTGSVME